MKAVKKILKSEIDLIQFAKKVFTEKHRKALMEDKMKRPDHYPCMVYYGIYSDKGSLKLPEFISMKDFLDVEFEKLEMKETGIVVIKVEDINTAPETEIEAINEMLTNLGLVGMLMSKGDELHEFRRSHLVKIAADLGFELKPKYTA